MSNQILPCRCNASLLLCFIITWYCSGEDVDSVVQRNSATLQMLTNFTCNFKYTIASEPKYAQYFPERIGTYLTYNGNTHILSTTNVSKVIITCNQKEIYSDNIFPDGKVLSSIIHDDGSGYGANDIRYACMFMLYTEKMKLIDFHEFAKLYNKHFSKIEESGSLINLHYRYSDAESIHTFDKNRNYLRVKHVYMEKGKITSVNEIVGFSKIGNYLSVPSKVTTHVSKNGTLQLTQTVELSNWKILPPHIANPVPEWKPYPNSLVHDMISRKQVKYGNDGKNLVKRVPILQPMLQILRRQTG